MQKVDNEVEAPQSVIAFTSKFHFGLAVSNLERSVEFYRNLFDSQPAKHLSDFAKFEVEDPPVVLALHPGKFNSSGALNHVGFRLASSDELLKVQERLEMRGIATQREEGVECCYARQTKFWVPDPDGHLWEIYTLDEDLDHSGFGGLENELPSRVPSTEKEICWEHLLTKPIPDRIPYDDDTVDEVRLEGTFNANHEPSKRAALLKDALRVLKPRGRIWVHALVSNQPVLSKPQLPGPASLVEHIPVETLPIDELQLAGFIGMNIEKISDIHCFSIDGVELRQLQMTALKRSSCSGRTDHYVVYRGPHAFATDDCGNNYTRGILVKVDAELWGTLRQNPFREHFCCMLSRSTPNVGQ